MPAEAQYGTAYAAWPLEVRMPFDAIRHVLVSSPSHPQHRGTAWERLMDFALATVAMVFLTPLMAMVALVVFMERRGPIFFQHERVGLRDSRFYVLKFRTMCMDGDRILAEHLAASTDAMSEWVADHKLRNDPRVSRLGRFLRKSSLDELPQLWNVFRGDMSIVGPRPIVEAEIERYGQFFSAYCAVKPGITGIWQVSGRNDLSYQRRVELDALYARKKSLTLDLQIIFATIPAVLLRRGSY